MEAQAKQWLIAGLGNPGKEYAKTRHNIGFMVVERLASRLGSTFRSERRWPGVAARGATAEANWHLLMPTTYMNLSGQAVRSYLDYYQIPRQQLLVVVDDIALSFGTLRLRQQGSAGGHNGLKSVEAHLGSADYMRLKVGIGDPDHADLADYVLSTFSAEEQRELPAILERATETLLAVPKGQLQQLMSSVNAKAAKKEELELQENNKHESRE